VPPNRRMKLTKRGLAFGPPLDKHARAWQLMRGRYAATLFSHLLPTMRLIALGVLTCLSSVTAISAQAPRLRLTAADSLIYREVSRGHVTIQMPQGPLEVRTLHDARIAIVGMLPGQVKAWYRSLVLRNEGPGPTVQAPDTKDMLQVPFELEITGNGAVTVRKTPPMPDAIAAMTDLTHQFDDFLIPLPPLPITAGITWIDSATSTASGRPENSYRGTFVRRFTYRGDTTIAGNPAWRIGIASRVILEASSPLQGMTVATILTGADTGSAVIRAADGHLLRRDKSGSLKGVLKMTGNGQSMDAPQVFTYESTIQKQ